MKLGIPKESRPGETRVAATPESVKKLLKKGFEVCVEKAAGIRAGFPTEAYSAEGAQVVDSAAAFGADVVLKLHPPAPEEIRQMRKGAVLVSFLEPYRAGGALPQLAEAGVSALAMELLPRTSRAQSMDALSSQANIAGYRAVLEAAARYGRFLPLMMTSAGSAKPARLIVLGVGVAGLQAIATARRLGASVEAYDVRPEVREQILSLGAKPIDLDVGEQGSGHGGYARELSEEGKRKQQQLLTERLKKADIIVTTANIPGRKAPILVTEEAVQGMRAGSVIIDMAAGNGGNCPLSRPDEAVMHHGVAIVGITNYPALVPADSSSFYAGNLSNLLALVTAISEGKMTLNLNLEDDIVAASLATHLGVVRFKRGG